MIRLRLICERTPSVACQAGSPDNKTFSYTQS